MTTSKLRDPALLEAQFASVCQRASLPVAGVAPHVKRRMLLLAEFTATFDDGVRAMELAEQVFAYCALHSEPFSDGEKNEVRAGSLLSDIGKTGPLRATLEQQRLIARMFSIEGVHDDQMSVDAFFATYFSADVVRCRDLFRALGLDSAMALRDFWNLHSEWTFELLQDSGVPPEAVPAAATHHLLEHVNPYAMVAADNTFTQPFGTNGAFDRAEKLVILLDKYDALRRRAHRGHVASIAWLRRLLSTHTRFSNDAEFNALLDVMDVVFATTIHEHYGT